MGSSPDELTEEAERLYDWRQMAAMVLESAGASDRALDILLYLYVNRDRFVTFGKAVDASLIPSTTALRLLTKLQDVRLIDRRENAQDRRSSYVQLSKAGMSVVERLLRTAH